MAFEEILPFLPYLSVLGFIITLLLILYRMGRWTKNIEKDLEGISKKLDNLAPKIEKMPEEFWRKFIDVYILTYLKKGNPSVSRKEELLRKANNRTITYEESLELKDILEKEAKNAQAVGDFFKFLVIMGILIFIGALIAELFGGEG